MPKGLSYSVSLHTILIGILIVGLPTFRKDINTDYAIVVDVVNISELTNVLTKQAPKIKEEKKTHDKPVPSVKTETSPEKPAVAEPKTQEIKEEKLEKISEKEAKKPEETKKPKEEKAKESEKKEKKKKDDSFEKSILKSLDEASKKKQDQKVDKEFTDIAKALKGETNKEYNPTLPMSISEVDAIKSQIARNWNTSSFNGAQDAKKMQVTVHIKLDAEGNVINVEPVYKHNASAFYKSFVESTVRAIKISSPIQNLTKEKYQTWKEIEFNFDASGMIY